MRRTFDFFDTLGLAGGILAVIAVAALFYGWVMNLIAFIQGVVNFDPNGNWVLLIARGVGIVVGIIGAVLGYF